MGTKKSYALRAGRAPTLMCCALLALTLCHLPAWSGQSADPSGNRITQDAVSGGGGPVTSAGGVANTMVGQFVVGYAQSAGSDEIFHGALQPLGPDDGPARGLSANVSGDGSVEKEVGETHVFTVVVAGELGTLSYQWYRDVDGGGFQAISGATGTTYTLDPVTASDAGQYLCEVTDDSGTVQTSPVTLLVSWPTNLPSLTFAGATILAAMLLAIGALKLRPKQEAKQ